jgi:hypothetical protein
LCNNIMMKRKNISFDREVGDVEYGHWWVEMGDESYGWWPKYPVGYWETLTGVEGELNGQTTFGGSGTRDPHHGDMADDSFYPIIELNDNTCSENCWDACNHAADCIRNFANSFAKSYGGTWSWPFGQNCRSFQTTMMSHCNLQR